MKPERWQDVDELFRAALMHTPNNRSAFLDQACADDEDLRQEVESRLFAHEQAETIVGLPDLAKAGHTNLAGERRTPDPYVGVLLKRRYLIEKELGRGGIGIVYLARDKQLLSRPVVVKVLLKEPGQKDWFKKKFRQEIEAMARINHPGVVGVLDTGQMPNGKPFLVMQFVEGVELRRLINPEGMDFERVAVIMKQIGQALSAAHERGIYHRDLKPENIMIQTVSDGEEYVKLIDFGVAIVKDPQASDHTHTETVAGTVAYMAPEQLMGKPSALSDVYALGVIAYEMVTGRRPFSPASPFQLYELQRAGVQAQPVDLRPGLPLSAQEVILKALSFDAKNRQMRARDFGEGLAKALTSEARSTRSNPSAPTAEISLGPFVFKMCNRSRQVNEFASFFINNMKQRLGVPQIYLIHGGERECHDSLIERLLYTQIKPFAEKKFGEQNGLVVSKKLGWPYEGEMAELHQELKRILFADFNPLYMDEDLSANALRDLASLTLSSFIVIHHRIHAARWNKATPSLIQWYFQFWADMAAKAGAPTFLIFISVIYPGTRASGWWKTWWRQKSFDKGRIERELGAISTVHNFGLPCLLLRELLPLKRDEVEDWFSLNNLYSEKVRYELLENMFRTEDGQAADHKNMADIEHELQRLVESIQQTFMRAKGYL